MNRALYSTQSPSVYWDHISFPPVADGEAVQALLLQLILHAVHHFSNLAYAVALVDH